MADKVFVLMCYVDDVDEVNCDVYRTKQGAVDYLKSEIRRWHESGVDDGDEGAEIEQMSADMLTKGVWYAGDGLEYVLTEREIHR